MADFESRAELRESVEGFLRKSFEEVSIDGDGDFEIRSHGVTTWVQLRPVGEDQTVVLVWAVQNVGMDAGGDLADFLATEANNLAFGQFELHDEPPRVHVSHALMGEFMSREELEVAVEAVAETSARYGPVVKERFGGVRGAELGK